MFNPETVVFLKDGKTIHCPASPFRCEYIRVEDGETEVGYWSSEEFQEDPEEVMGALMELLRSKPTIGYEAPEKNPMFRQFSPRDQLVSIANGLAGNVSNMEDGLKPNIENMRLLTDLLLGLIPWF